MHYHLELIMPPPVNSENAAISLGGPPRNWVETAVEQVLEPFSEQNPENEHSFYDWYEIGGRWKGTHKINEMSTLNNLSNIVNAARFIVALSDEAGNYSAEFMLEESLWNGVNFVDSAWQGSIKEALTMYDKRTAHYHASYNKAYKPQDNWVSVTVDYHS